MDHTRTTALRGVVVDDELTLTTIELARASSVTESHIELWVSEGVLQAQGDSPQEWRFSGGALSRSRIAMRLSRDLEINSAGVALALDLLERIEQLEARLRRGPATGTGPPRP